MPVEQELRENGRVIYVRITDPLTAEELMASAKEQTRFYDNAEGVLHQLADFSKLSTLPNHILRLAQNVPGIKHPKRGQLIVIGANTFVHVVGEMLMRLMHFNTIKFASTEAQAWNEIRKVIEKETISVPSVADSGMRK